MGYFLHVIAASDYLFNFLGSNDLVMMTAAIVVGYSISIYPIIRKSKVWIAHSVGVMLFVFMMIQLIEVTGNERSWVLVVWGFTIFFANMLGQIPPITMLGLNIMGVFLTMSGAFETDNFNLGLIRVFAFSFCAFFGWLLFRKKYIQYDSEDSKLERLNSMLREEQLKSEILIESIADGVVVVDKQGAIQLFNPAAAAMTGWHVDEALGIDHRSILVFYNERDENITDVNNPFATVLEKAKHVSDNKIKLATRSGSKIFLSLVISPVIHHGTGEIAGAIAIFRDISKQHQEEAARAEFISTASHEMRTPVASIEGYLALALNPAVSKIDDKAREYLMKAHSATKHLGQLFQDLLTISKAEDGRLQNRPVVIEAGALCRELSEQWGFAASKKNLAVKYMIGEQIVSGNSSRVMLPVYYVKVDPERIREVLTNLFDNAVKYTIKGSITVRIDADSENVKISIEDTGQGIPREDIPHLFQKFYRVDSSDTRQIGGTGLGLYICKKIIDLYHGRISVDSELGKGSRFTVSLPRLSRSEAEEEIKQEQSKQIKTTNNPEIKPQIIEPAPQAISNRVPASTPQPATEVQAAQPNQSLEAKT